jgi:putative ABC transport system permease protein
VDRSSTDVFLRQAVNPTRHGPPDFSAPTRTLRVGDELTINDHRVLVAGIARVSPRFLFRPTLYTTFSHATSIAPGERNLLSFVLAHARPGVDPRELAERITAQTGLRARTAAQFKSDTAWYISLNGGVILRMGVMVGIAFLVGVIMTGLLLYLFTVENLRYYATLKALGTTDRRIVRMVAAQAAACGAIGFGLGIGASSLLGTLLSRADQPYLLIWPTLAATGAVVMLICICAGALSCIKVARLEPGMVFRA